MPNIFKIMGDFLTLPEYVFISAANSDDLPSQSKHHYFFARPPRFELGTAVLETVMIPFHHGHV
jgi:hypothetical protein